MARYSLVLLALAVGCSATDPASDRLKPGQKVVTIDVVVIKAPPDRPFPPNDIANKFPMLRAGEKAQVLTDESTEGSSIRPVILKILTDSGSNTKGQLVGLVCTIRRKDLRSIQQE